MTYKLVDHPSRETSAETLSWLSPALIFPLIVVLRPISGPSRMTPVPGSEASQQFDLDPARRRSSTSEVG